MKNNLRLVGAMIKKDLLSLLPLVLLALAAFFITPLVASLDLASMGGDTQFWLMLQSNIYWLGFFLGILLMISVVQLDPADSLNHDWLTRPVARRDWLLAKLLFLALVIVVPVLLARFLTNLSQGLGPGLSFIYSFGVEELESVLLVPLLLAAALLAPNLRKLILLLVMVFFVFLLPGWSVTRPILASLGVELGSEFDGLMWVQGLFIVLAGLIGAGLIFWFHYSRRQATWAYAFFWATVLVMFLAVYPPQSLYNWDRAIAINAALINADNAGIEDQVILEKAAACFPAVPIDNSYSSAQDNQLLSEAAWLEGYLQAAGPGAISFATPIRYRELLTEWFAPAGASREQSVEWRFDRIRRRARFSADSLQEDVALNHSPTALNRFMPISVTETDYWIVPGDLLETVADDPSTQLIMEIDGTLFSPTPYELPTDGQRYSFPELGSCKADLDRAGNVVTVECLKRGKRPELVSAQFFGLDSSRVDNASRGSYTHDWVESLSRERYELTLESPSLVGLTHGSPVMLIAYNAERVLRKQLVFDGVLGGSQAICPLPGDNNKDIERSSNWSDKSPHEVSSVAVDNGVRLEVLDWRRDIKSDTPTLLLLPGLGATAHSYDEIAPRLAEKYNVLGVTRRGVGASSKPDRGYDIARLARDVLQVLDTLEIESAILVGHSFGGEELSYLGARYPQRIAGLIYLDAAYDRVSVNSGPEYKESRQLNQSLPPRPPVRPEEAASYEAMQTYIQRTGGTKNIPEGEIMASYDLTTGNIKHDELYLDALMAGLMPPDYKNISVPALALYAVPGAPDALMEAWYDQDDPVTQQTVKELFHLDRARRLAEIERFQTEVQKSRVVVLENADHWIFVSHQQEVLAAMEDFIQGLGLNESPQSTRASEVPDGAN